MTSSSGERLSFPPGLPAPVTPVVSKTPLAKLEDTTPSKKRRVRLMRLSAGNEDRAHYEACTQTSTSSDKRLETVVAKVNQLVKAVSDIGLVKENMDKLEKKMDQQNQKSDGIAQLLQELLQNKPPLPTTPRENYHDSVGGNEPDTDLLDSIFCSRCMKLCYACKCSDAAFESRVCDGCGLHDPLTRLLLSDLELMLKCGHVPARRSLDVPCPRCKCSSTIVKVNNLEHDRVCEECLGAEEQDCLQTCDAHGCSTDGFMHTKCMRLFKDYPTGSNTFEDLYVCNVCFAEGKVPHVDDSESGSSNAESDEEYRMVEEYGELKVGMAHKGGVILEIFPGLNKYTVARRSTSGTEIHHFKICQNL